MNFLGPLIAFLAFCFPFVAVSSEILEIDAGRGVVPVHIPDGHSANDNVPIVVLLHGLGADAKTQNEGGKLPIFPAKSVTGMKFSTKVDAKNFILVLPDGSFQSVPVLGRHRFWNATDACCDFQPQDPSDATYILSLIDAVIAHDRTGISQKEIFIVGHSNGGFLAHRIGCEFSNRISAIVSVAGATYLNPDDCKNRSANARIAKLHVLQVHGNEDVTVVFDGGDRLLGYPAPAPYPGAKATTQNWATIMQENGSCNAPNNPSRTIDDSLALVDPIGDTIVFEYDCPDPGTSIELWVMSEEDHLPKFSDKLADTILDHLYQLQN